LTYELRHGTTIGILIDKIIERKMHHFLFLPYTSELLWKGCGDHAYALKLFYSILGTILML